MEFSSGVYRNIGKPNTLKVFESYKTKEPKQDSQIGEGRLCLRLRRTLVLMIIITLFRNCRLQ